MVGKKQFGDGGEHLVAGEFIMAGLMAAPMPQHWPGYDLIVQPPHDERPLRVSVKTRRLQPNNPVVYRDCDKFDWLAVVLIAVNERQFFVIPRTVADARASWWRRRPDHPDEAYWEATHTRKRFPEYENNFLLKR